MTHCTQDRRRKATRARPAAGFTIIELLVVMGILALVLATVFVARPRTAVLRVEAAARGLADSMRAARAAAMTHNIETVFVFDTDARRYGTGQATNPLPMGIDVDLKIAEPERSGATGGFRFYPDGQSSGGDVVLSLQGFRARIAVNWLTGRAAVVPEDRP